MIQISPLLFLILVENAFKHGVENLTEDAFVDINLKVKGKQLSFAIENNFDPDGLTEKKGIGLDNLRRRLELVYPKKHKLTFNTKNQVYRAELTLDLA